MNDIPQCNIVSTRTIHASRERVFQAYTNPEILQKWWGPHGFSNVFHTYEYRVGGEWTFTMHDDVHNVDYLNECIFVTIEEPTHLVWDHILPKFQIDIRFEEVAPDMTRVTFTMIFDTPEECAAMMHFVPEKNEENFDRVEKVLREEQ